MNELLKMFGRRATHFLAVAAMLLLPLGTAAQSTSLGTNILTNGNLTVNGNSALGSDAADTISFLGVVQNGSPLIFEGTTADGFETTLAITDPTADRTITLPDADGTVAVSASGNIALSAAGDISFTGTLPVASGGTGATTFTSNGLLYGNAAGAVQVTAAGTSGQLPIANGSGVPTFVTMSGDATIDNTGALTIGADKVALTTDTTGDYVDSVTGGNGIAVTGGSGEASTPSFALGQLTANWVQDGDFNIDLGAGGFLRLESSGSNNFWGTFQAANLSADQTYTMPNQTGTVLLDSSSIAASSLTGQVAIANGGTERASFGQNTVVLGNSGNPLNETNVGTNGQLLLGRTSNTPLFASMSGDATITSAGVVTVADDSHSHTAGTITEADPVYGGSAAASITNAGSGLVITGTERTNFGTAYSHTSLTNNPHTVTATQVGLGSVENTALSTWVGTSNITTLGTITTGVWNGTDIAIADGGTGAGDAATARTNLGLVIGTNVQAWDTDLDSWSALTTSSKANSGANTDINNLTPTHTNWAIANNGDATFANVNTGNVLMGGNLVHSVTAGVTAGAGGGQGSATQIVNDIEYVATVASAGDSVKLPAIGGNTGMIIHVINGQAVNAMDVFPNTGDSINGAAINIAKSLPANQTMMCMAYGAAAWECVTLSR